MQHEAGSSGGAYVSLPFLSVYMSSDLPLQHMLVLLLFFFFCPTYVIHINFRYEKSTEKVPKWYN